MEIIAHQFDDSDQQKDAATLGMWVFLATEILFFGGMFLGYTVYRSAYGSGFGEASGHLNVLLGTVNTAVLLCSSLTMAMAAREAQIGSRRMLIAFLSITMMLGTVFIAIKFYEYYAKYEEGLIPGPHFIWSGTDSAQASIFFLFYFIMTGMHALHMVIGLGLMTVLIILAKMNRFSPAHHTPVEMSALYWHFVDIIWVFLFPLLYLVDRSR